MSQQSNYKLKYKKFIESRPRRTQTKPGYEKHHILPVSLGGTDDKSNIIILTYREHYIAHKMLAKMYRGEKKYKMVCALFHFFNESNSHKYESIKNYYKEQRRQKMLDNWQNPAYKEYQTKRLQKFWQDPINKKKQSQAKKEKLKDKDFVANQRKADVLRKDWSQKNAKKLSTISKNLWQDPVYRAKQMADRQSRTSYKVKHR